MFEINAYKLPSQESTLFPHISIHALFFSCTSASVNFGKIMFLIVFSSTFACINSRITSRLVLLSCPELNISSSDISGKSLSNCFLRSSSPRLASASTAIRIISRRIRAGFSCSPATVCTFLITASISIIINSKASIPYMWTDSPLPSCFLRYSREESLINWQFSFSDCKSPASRSAIYSPHFLAVSYFWCSHGNHFFEMVKHFCNTNPEKFMVYLYHGFVFQTVSCNHYSNVDVHGYTTHKNIQRLLHSKAHHL